MNNGTFTNAKALLFSAILILALANLSGCAKEEHPTGTEAGHPTAEAEAEHPTAEVEAEAEHPTEEAEAEHLTEEAAAEHPTEEAEAEHPTAEAEAEHLTEEAEAEHPTEEVEAEHPTEEAEEEQPTEETEAEHPDKEETSKDTESEQPQAQPKREVGLADISDGIKKHIADVSGQFTDGMFHADYAGKDVALTLVKVHDEKLAILGSGAYFACTDLKDTDGNIYDLDFFLTGEVGNMKVTETTVHKDNGKPLYNWKQQNDGVWIKIP